MRAGDARAGHGRSGDEDWLKSTSLECATKTKRALTHLSTPPLCLTSNLCPRWTQSRSCHGTPSSFRQRSKIRKISSSWTRRWNWSVSEPRELIQQAHEAFEASEIPVGCVLVRDGQIISTGRNRTNELRNVRQDDCTCSRTQATLHAEFEALSALLPPPSAPSRTADDPLPEHSALPSFRDVALYVTVEPCLMCAAALRQVGIGKIVYGCGNERFGGCGGVRSVHAE